MLPWTALLFAAAHAAPDPAHAAPDPAHAAPDAAPAALPAPGPLDTTVDGLAVAGPVDARMVEVKTREVLHVRLLNQGKGSVTVQALRLEGGDGAFVLDAPAAAIGPLAPGEAREVEVGFAPQRVGEFSTTVMVKTEGGIARVRVAGRGEKGLGRGVGGLTGVRGEGPLMVTKLKVFGPGMTEEDVRRALEPVEPRLRECQVAVRTEAPEVSGNLRAKVKLDGLGRVDEVTVTARVDSAAPLIPCVTDALHHLVLPIPSQDLSTLTTFELLFPK